MVDMRFFFLEWVNDFEKMMLDSLAQENPVYQVNRIMRRFKSINKLLPGQYLKKLHKKIHCAKKFSLIKNSDVIVCNGYSVFPFLDYVQTMHCKKILILRDSVDALTTKRRKLGQLAENQDYIETVKPIFDVIFSFDPQDSKTYGLTYIKQFVPFTWQQIQSANRAPHPIGNSCFYVGGYQTERVDLINKITPLLLKENCKTDFYLMDKYHHDSNYPANCKNMKLSYQENIEKLNQSRFVLEINKPDQTGLTLRSVEALVFNKKLITNNSAIKEQEFYHPSRVFIFDGKNQHELKQFLHIEPVAATAEIASKYSADGMLETLKQHIS
ncbi:MULTISPECIES: hypothetical protein [unclassified Buttiauxella]|uniref:hypothetical protein n=1 Tax=unclassified Buttiauxella TaxID=2634062 RepID=UPI00105B974B|nr:MULTISPECIES: hypothetical protein [unclassified Buttiauxella]